MYLLLQNGDQISIVTLVFRGRGCFSTRQNDFSSFPSLWVNIPIKKKWRTWRIDRSRPKTNSWNAQQKSSYASDVPFPIHSKIEWDQIPTDLTFSKLQSSY